MSAVPDEPGWHMRPPQQPYVEELHRENERLRGQVSFLEEENETRRAENRKLEQRLKASLEAISRRKSQEDLLLRQLDDTIEKNRRLSDRCASVEHKCIDFAHLLTASYRLQRACDRSTVAEVLQEILVNLVGCEEFSLFECVAGGEDLRPLVSLERRSVAEAVPAKTVVADGLLAEALARRQVVFAEQTEEEQGEAAPSVCIPLCAGEQPVGLVVLYRLLPQKLEGLTMLDGELLDLVTWQGGRALHWAIQYGKEFRA